MGESAGKQGCGDHLERDLCSHVCHGEGSSRPRVCATTNQELRGDSPPETNTAQCGFRCEISSVVVLSYSGTELLIFWEGGG